MYMQAASAHIRAHTYTLVLTYPQLHVRLEHNPEVDELQKRVKILQGKLDKQKQHIRENEEALKAQHPVGVASGRGVAAVEASAQIDSKVSILLLQPCREVRVYNVHV